MTACNIIIEPDRALVWTDSAVFNMAGDIIGHHRKTIPIEGMKAVISVCGIPFIAEFLAKELAKLVAEIGTTFDDIIASDGALVDEVFTAVAPFAPTLGTLPRRFWITGWSDADGCPKCLGFSNVGDAARWWPVESDLVPSISTDGVLLIHGAVGQTGAPGFDSRRLGKPLMQAQSIPVEEPPASFEGLMIAGGDILETIVSAESVSQAKVHELPLETSPRKP